jgi:biotin synthase
VKTKHPNRGVKDSVVACLNEELAAGAGGRQSKRPPLKTIRSILDRTLENQPPSREECRVLLELPPASLEASRLRATADFISRRRFGNQAILLGQIGIETAPCPGDCLFCVFGQGHTTFPQAKLSLEEILQRTQSFAAGDDLFALFLMTMHDFELERLLQIVQAVRKTLPSHTRIVVNIGDFDLTQARELRGAGVSGAYHVCRLREGLDTALDPASRQKTFSAIREADLDFYYCCEPIGPEHSAGELVEQLFLGLEYGCFQHAAMRRVHIPGSPLANRGQITELRLAQIVAVVTLATLGCAQTQNIAVHEPNLLGLAAGANAVYAETAANPRDTRADTSGNRGLDMPACRKLLYEAGFTRLLRGDGTSVNLDLQYLLAAEGVH